MKRIITAILGLSALVSCQVEHIIQSEPVMMTYEPENILTTSASLGGLVVTEGGLRVSEYGIVYGTNSNPTIADTKQAAGSGKGEFLNSYEGLLPNTTYYYRTYGTNPIGTGYGEQYTFTTQGLPPCNPVAENSIYTGPAFHTIPINSVTMQSGYDSMSDGNVEFETSTWSSAIRIFLKFNEIDLRLPKTGTYRINGGFDSQSPYSVGEVDVFLYNYGSPIGGANAVVGQNIYVKNENGVVTFIFCDTEFNNYYKLNGKFTYVP